jgi:hypothetical protein
MKKSKPISCQFSRKQITEDTALKLLNELLDAKKVIDNCYDFLIERITGIRINDKK